MSLATLAGDEVKIFGDGESVSSAFTELGETHSLLGNITWSGDAKWIAVTPLKSQDDPLPVYKYNGTQLVPKKYVGIASVTSASFFNWTNGNLAVGTQTGRVYIWDLLNRKIALNVDRHQQCLSVDYLCVNSDDTLLASASFSANKVCVHSLNTNKVVETLTIPNSQGASGLSYCLCKRSYLAASSYESTICVWDVVKSEVVFNTLNSHNGACTDISFSPINYCLIASVGLTKRLKMYDLRQGSLIFDENLGISLHCIDMMSNGDKVAVGGSDGTVTIYDLRANKVQKQFEAHRGPVLSIRIQLMKLPQKYKEVEMNTPDVIEIHNKTLDLSVIDVLSPISRGEGIRSTSVSKSVSFVKVNKTVEDDSFMNKFITPKKQDIFMSTPVEDSLHSENVNCIMNSARLVAGTVVEEAAEANEIPVKIEQSQETPGDGFHIRRQGLEHSVQNSLGEIKNMLQEQLNMSKDMSVRLSTLEKEVQLIKADLEEKHQLHVEHYNNLLEFMIKGIKDEVFSGNFDAKMEHVCVRLLLQNFHKSATENIDLILKDVRKILSTLH